MILQNPVILLSLQITQLISVMAKKLKTKQRYELLLKPLVIRQTELVSSLQIIRDCLTLIDKGKQYQFIPIYGQLRSILTEKSKKHPSLLFEVAEKLKEKPEVFYIPFENFPEHLGKNYFHFSSPEVSYTNESEKHVGISLEKFLSEKIIELESQKYSVNQIIGDLANNFGGAHYASKIGKDTATLFYFNLFNHSLNQLIFQLSKVILKIGIPIVQKFNTLTFYNYIFIPLQKIENERYLFDYYNENYKVRYSLLINSKKKFKLSVIDFFKNEFVFESNKPVELDSFFNIRITLGINDDLQSVISLMVNEELLINKQFDTFLPLSNELHLFKRFYNRSVENSNSGLIFFSYQIIQRIKIDREEDSKIISNYLKSDVNFDSKGILFSHGNYGLTSPGDRSIIMYGNVEHMSINEFKKNN